MAGFLVSHYTPSKDLKHWVSGWVKSLREPISVLMKPAPCTKYAPLEELTLHMDDPPARYIAWLGMVTPEQEEPTKFLDTRPILEMLSPEETRIKSIQVKDDNGLIHPMLADDGVFHYVPWMIQMQTVTDNDTFEALAHLQSLIHKATRTCHTINIQKGEILIVDNTRVIHGRDRIAADSQRHLKRLWIK